MMIQEKARPRTGLPVDETDLLTGQILKFADTEGVSLGGHESEFAEEEIDDHGLDVGNQLFQVGNIVLPGFGIEQVRPGDVREALIKSGKPLRAPRIRGEDDQFGIGLPQTGMENIEDRIVAARGQKRPRNPAALLPLRGPF
jgi:hypothetical protein